MSAKPGRNDPCPCGSGRKFKACCGDPSAASTKSAVAPSWYAQATADLNAGRLAAAIRLAESAWRAHSGQPECARFADQLAAAVNRDCESFIRTPSPDSARRLQQVRLQLVESLITIPQGALQSSWPLVARPHARLMGCGLRDFVRAPEEESVMQQLKGLLTAGSAAGRPEPASGSTATGSPAALPAPEVMLAAMLLARNFELPLIGDVEHLPDWLRPVYLEMLLESPQVFNQIGEADRYVDFLEQVTEVVRERWVRGAEQNANPVLRELAGAYAMRAVYTQAYFSSRNLRPLYEKRGAILAAFLAWQAVPALTAIPPRPASAGGKIKLGIFTHRFTPGTETYFTLSHFEHLDRNRFDVTLYALVWTDHALEKYCASRADRVVVLNSNDLMSQIQRVREDRLDMLLISTNMTTHTIASTLLGSTRLAPIQLASVSSPVTTGARHTDVMLSAEWNEPEPDAQDQYTEHLERLPGSINYYAYHHDHDPVTVEVTRERLGIPADSVVFFSGANFFKILPELSASWARILAAVPNSILLLMPFNPNWGSNYQRLPFLARVHQQLRAAGVPAERARVIETVPTRADVHCVMSVADVYLDAYPFAGACSMLDSILVCLPAVVRTGKVGRSNHGAALLRMVGLEELSCDTEADYVSRAVSLANDPGERRRIREHLLKLKQAEVPVYYDTALFSSRVGAALERLHERHQRRYREIAAAPALLRASIEQSACSLIGERTDLNALTDIGIVRLLIGPYFQSLPAAGPRRVLDVGACHGAMSEPLLAQGWHADLFEPDPAAREVLQRNLAPYADRARVHAMAVGSQSTDSIAFHQASVQGLSGLGESPFGATTRLIEVPCLTLADFCERHRVTTIDLLKIDAEGFDFDVLESLRFDRVQPELVLVEYGTHFPRQTRAAINKVLADMDSRGYGAVIFAYADDGNFKRWIWVYRLTGLYVDRDIPESGEVFGNILFYRKRDPQLLLTLQSLLDNCHAPRKPWLAGSSAG